MGRAGHRAAFLLATTARLRAGPAMVVFESRALVGAGFADIRAQRAKRIRELRAAAHESGRLPADRGAILVQANARDHPVDAFFVKAGIGAMLACLRTFDAGLDA